MDSGNITVSIKYRIATVSFYHPTSNSMPSNLLHQLTDVFNQLDGNNEVNCIILKSQNNSTFCAGASFDELISINNEAEGLAFFSGFANVINAMRKCSKLIIGRAQGKAVGGGVGLLSATDYCFATDQAAIKLSEFTIGIGPFVIAPVVERKMGIAATADCAGRNLFRPICRQRGSGNYHVVCADCHRADQERDSIWPIVRFDGRGNASGGGSLARRGGR